MTNEDIKKALEYCTGSEGIEGCEKCPYFSIYMCNDTLCKDALNLITEQEKDIKQLKTECALLDDAHCEAGHNRRAEQGKRKVE